MPSDRPPSARKPQAAKSWSFARLGLLLAASAALAGCAVPGEPIARHPVVPDPVKDLTAQQRGDAVVLSFTLPKNSTDQKPLGAVPTAEVYRSTLSSTSSAAAHAGRADNLSLRHTWQTRFPAASSRLPRKTDARKSWIRSIVRS